MNLIDIEPYKDGKIVYNDEDHGIKIKDLPVVDAVEIVRCKDCKFFDTTEMCNCGFTNLYLREPDDFCSYGETEGD